MTFWFLFLNFAPRPKPPSQVGTGQLARDGPGGLPAARVTVAQRSSPRARSWAQGSCYSKPAPCPTSYSNMSTGSPRALALCQALRRGASASGSPLQHGCRPWGVTRTAGTALASAVNSQQRTEDFLGSRGDTEQSSVLQPWWGSRCQ